MCLLLQEAVAITAKGMASNMVTLESALLKLAAEDVEATQHAHVLLDALVVHEHVVKTDPEQLAHFKAICEEYKPVCDRALKCAASAFEI